MKNLCAALAGIVAIASAYIAPAIAQDVRESAVRALSDLPVSEVPGGEMYDEDICIRVLEAGPPAGAFLLPADGGPPDPNQVLPGELHPSLRDERLAVRLSLGARPVVGPPQYRLNVDVIGLEAAKDLQVTLVMPSQIEASGIDGQLLLRGTRPGYLAATPRVEYAGYELGRRDVVGRSGLRRYRFDISTLPTLGRIEATVRATHLLSEESLHSYGHISFDSPVTAGERPELSYLSYLGPHEAVAANLWEACNADDLAAVIGKIDSLRRLEYGGADFDINPVVSGETDQDFCLEGLLQFSDVADQQHPVAGAQVQLIEGFADTGSVIETASTGDDGRFLLEFDLDAVPDTSFLNMRFSALGEFTAIHKSEVDSPVWSIGLLESLAQPGDLAQGPPALDIEQLVTDAPGLCLDLGSIIADAEAHQENNHAFEIFSALNLAGTAAKDVLPGIDHLPAVYPNPLFLGLLQAVSVFRADNGEGVPSILVASLDPHNWDILLHEYGHYAQHVRGYPAPDGMPHSVHQNHCNGLPKGEAIRFGWFEAWPTAMAMATQKNIPATYDTLPTVKDGAYTRLDLDGNPLFEVPMDPNSIELPSQASESTEFVITSALWELYEHASFQSNYTPPAAAQAINLDYGSWVDLTGDPDITYFSDFCHSVLLELGTGGIFDPRAGAMLQRHRVGPAIIPDGPAERLRSRWLFSLRNSPNCDMLTPASRLRYFLRVYDADYQSVIWESTHGESPVVSAPVSELKAFLTGSGETLHWHAGAVHPCKESGGACDPQDISNPSTGEYLGAAWTMTDDQAICPWWLLYLLVALFLLLALLVVLLLLGSNPLLFIAALAVASVLGILLYCYWYCLFG